jgi:hypothetical protein
VKSILFGFETYFDRKGYEESGKVTRNLERLRGIWKGYEEMASSDEKFLVRVRNVFGRIRNIFLEREMTYFLERILECM